MTQDRNIRPISDVILERYTLGELPETEIRMLEDRLALDPILRRRLEALKAHNQVFEASFPAEEMVARINAAVNAPRRYRNPEPVQKFDLSQRLAEVFRFSRGWQIATAFALLMLTTLPVMLFMNPAVNPAVEPEGVRLKGQEAELRLYRNTPAGPERVKPGASVTAGDVIQVEFHPGGFAFGAIVSVDGMGAVTLHWPTRPDAGTALSALSEYRLPKAFQLDNAPGFERFHLLLSAQPIDLGKMRSLVAASSSRDESWLASQSPQSVRVIGFTLKKGP